MAVLSGFTKEATTFAGWFAGSDTGCTSLVATLMECHDDSQCHCYLCIYTTLLMETRDSPFPLICIATSGICRRFDSTCMNDCSVDGIQHNTVKLTRRCVPRLGRYSAEVTWKVALAVEPTATEPEGEREVK